MLDFTSALYLGIRHPSRSLRSWPSLTAGRPAALESPPTAETVARSLAALTGCERVEFFPSTLHLFFDLFEALRHKGVRLYVDGGAYPIARWGAERAAARGVFLRTIPHYDPIAAQAIIEKDRASGTRPVILADGYCAHCGRAAPLKQFLSFVVPDNGYVVLDDTQALGVFGEAPDRVNPYGRGGGGSLRLHNIDSSSVIVGSSLAKGFGVPLAALGGSAQLIRQILPRSETRAHCSPPSMATLRAVEHALALNGAHGDAIRRHLAELVARFREQIDGKRISVSRSLFPVQALALDPYASAVRSHRMLREAGVRTVLVRKHNAPGAKLLFVFNASHSFDDVDQAAMLLNATMRQPRRATRAAPSERMNQSLQRKGSARRAEPLAIESSRNGRRRG
jgi:8-amino-7-oxononanoate synthase